MNSIRKYLEYSGLTNSQTEDIGQLQGPDMEWVRVAYCYSRKCARKLPSGAVSLAGTQIIVGMRTVSCPVCESALKWKTSHTEVKELD